ncbi:hypothetical protein JRG48_10470 [Staphylococcus caprae]|uniref:hypothetical protein n=1 Tax=Staphylococcus caprae TaxID=29380 RepID=UPI0019CF9C7D|nr:hypothetical protein [Staphylococcus caprae]MBN6826740.1 hypothetical protein [Staphylococcus caprae]
MLLFSINPDIFWSAFTAISTFLAVLVALFYPIYQNRAQRKLEVNQTINYDFEKGLVRLVITIDNIGNRNILINSMGFMSENKINITQNKLLKNSEMRPPFIIKKNDTKIIIYEYNNGESFTDKESAKLDINKVFYKKISLLDSLGKSYNNSKKFRNF